MRDYEFYIIKQNIVIKNDEGTHRLLIETDIVTKKILL
jgi:hypothetical protein